MKNHEVSYLMKICQVRAELFHADGRTDRHDEAYIRFSNFANVPKNFSPSTLSMSTCHLALIDIRVCIIHIEAHIFFELQLSRSLWQTPTDWDGSCCNASDLQLEWLNQISAWFPADLIEVLCDFCQLLRASAGILTLKRRRQRKNSNLSWTSDSVVK